MPEKLTEGWAYPARANKCHYMILEERLPGDRASFSLCGKYGFFRAPDALSADDGRANKDDCVPCRKRMEKRASLLSSDEVNV